MRVGQSRAKRSREWHRDQFGEAGRQADRHPPRQCAARRAQLLARQRYLVQYPTSVLQQQLARLGRHGTAAVAGEQVMVQFHFQQSNLAAERGLGDVQCDGRTREAAQFGDLHKVFELPEIHVSVWYSLAFIMPIRYIC